MSSTDEIPNGAIYTKSFDADRDFFAALAMRNLAVIAIFPPACGRPALYEKGGVSPTHCGEIVFLFLVRSRRRRGISMTLKPAARDCFALLAMTFARGA